MFRIPSRAVRWTPALVLSALIACVNAQRPAAAPPTRRTAALAVYDTITVTNTSGGTNVGSLRWAVSQATGGETIRFDPALAGATVKLDTTLQVPHYVTIEGPKTSGITISGGDKVRVIQVYRGASLRNVMITGGDQLLIAGGALDTGSAVATATTSDAATWTTPATSAAPVKLARSPK
jgi:hypothetical protein